MRIAPLTVGLGLSMTFGYGGLYYSFAILAPEIARTLNWDMKLVFGIFSVSLMAAAAIAPLVGRLLDRHGPRLIMSLGTVLGSIALCLFALVQSQWQFALAIILTECVAIATQYDAAFTALARKHGMNAGRHITGVTLIAGFSSTIFWPLIEYLLTITDWRGVYLVLAGLNLAICLPVHLLVPGRDDAPMAEGHRPEAPRPFTAPLAPVANRRLFMVLMGTVFAATGFLMSAVNASIMVLLGDIGLDLRSATWCVALIGPAQVLARILDLVFAHRLPATGVAVISSLGIGLAILVLLTASFMPSLWLVASFAVIYGAGQGLSSIVRGVLPLRFFGHQGYGQTTGVLSGWRLGVSAVAPVATITLADWGGAKASITGLAVVALVGIVSVLWLSARDPSRTPRPALPRTS